jgi:hypothetical protein
MLPLLINLKMFGNGEPIETMSYPISKARKILYDAISAQVSANIYDSIAPDDAEVPFIVMDTFNVQPGSKCGYNVVCRFSIYDQFIKQGGLLRSDDIGLKLLAICESVGLDVTITTSGNRTFNRANYRQQFQVTINT